MRLLVHSELFGEDQQDRYYLTPASLILRGDEPLSVALLFLDPIITDPRYHLSKWFATADSDTPVAVAHGTSLFEVIGHDERINRMFNEAMASDARIVTSLMVRDCGQVFEGLRSVVDVGGGVGTAAKVFADAFPGLNCTALDLPHVVAGLKGTGNLNFVAGETCLMPFLQLMQCSSG